ncbi:MAG: HAD family hydrolase [Erysipelotrichaceae bacterium]|jgi:pyrophosphatase PpaX|nr:HAD family hydrolase [Erysipelotrichaceae bacterium]
MKYKLVLFDLDGTLINTDEMIVSVFEKLYKKFRDGKMTPKNDIYYFSGPPLIDTVKKEFPDLDPYFMMSEYAKIAPTVYADTVTLYDDAIDVINKIKLLGIKIGVVTNKGKTSALFALKHFNISNLFDIVITLDDVKNGKPDKEGMLLAMKELNIENPKEVLYVGDNKVDYISADNAGIDSALVVWGPRVLDNNINPTVKISSYKELLDYVKKS